MTEGLVFIGQTTVRIFSKKLENVKLNTARMESIRMYYNWFGETVWICMDILEKFVKTLSD